MTIERFVAEVLEENKEELEEIIKLQEILDQLPEEKTMAYYISITSNL